MSIALVLILSMAISAPAIFFTARPVEPGVVLFGHSAVGDADRRDRLVRLRAVRVVDGRDELLARRGPAGNTGIKALAIAAWDVLTLKNLGGGGNGCNDNSEAFSMRRRYLHHAMFYGFMLCFAATTLGLCLSLVLWIGRRRIRC